MPMTYMYRIVVHGKTGDLQSNTNQCVYSTILGHACAYVIVGIEVCVQCPLVVDAW